MKIKLGHNNYINDFINTRGKLNCNIFLYFSKNKYVIQTNENHNTQKYSFSTILVMISNGGGYDLVKLVYYRN
jgi:hypothetical protein